jgi:hypothetical protein
MIELAGLLISGLGLLNDIASSEQELSKWTEEDLQVDEEWLSVAIEKGLLQGSPSDYTWSWASKVPTRELKGTHQVVYAFNKEKQIKYRIVQGVDSTMILTKRVTGT